MDATAYSFNKLEISIQILLDFTASNAGMSDTDFELYQCTLLMRYRKMQEANYQNEDFFEVQAK